MPTDRRARPTTSNPVTAPPLNATRSAECVELVAAWAVRLFDNTAIRMPMYPAAIEQVAPKRKPIAV
jgi:hypothetical protein